MGSPCPAQGPLCAGRRLTHNTASVKIVLAWLVAITWLGAVAPPPIAAQQSATVDADLLNLRADPAFSATPVGQTWSGQAVPVLAGPTSDGWYQIEANGAAGWVHGWYLFINGSLGWSPPTAADWTAAPPTLSSQNVNVAAPNSETGVGGPTASDPWPGQSPVEVVVPVERWVDINRTDQTVTVFDGAQPIATYWGAMGVDRSDAGFFATANGTFYVYEKYEDLSYTIWGRSWVRNWIGFDPNRLNGFHSYSMDWAGQVIPGGAGPTGGCVALDPWSAAQLFALVHVGTRVDVHW